MKILILLAMITTGTLSCYAKETKTKIEFYTIAENQTEYQCDGRQYCSQMTSCAEAKFFLNNCPDTKMDGNNDGIPCEKQWCGYSY